MSLSSGGDAWDYFFLAMAHAKLDHREEALSWYEKATACADKNRPADQELRSFRLEADAALAPKPPSPQE